MNHFKTLWQHLRRSPYQAMAAILVIGVTFYLATVFALLAVGSQAILRFFETRPQVTAFLKDEVKINQIETLKEKLQASGKVAEVKYVSKDEALSIYREQNKNDPSLLEMVTANMLPASLEVSAKDISYLADIAQVLKEEQGVEEVIFQEDVVSSLKTWITNIRREGLELVGLLALTSFLIIFIFTAIKVVFRKEEIEVLKLVGATRWYIRLPFLLEGIFYGVWGAVLGWGAAYVRILYLSPSLAEFLKDTSIPPVPPVEMMLVILGGEVLLAVFIGVLGSFFALGRYLK